MAPLVAPDIAPAAQTYDTATIMAGIYGAGIVGHKGAFEHGMFPPRALYPRYEARAQRKMPQRGDVSACSALMIHRGTANHSQKARPVLVLGVDAPDARNAERHDLQFTRPYYDALPESLKAHLACRVVDELKPVVQAHTIEGLMMGEA